MCFTISFMMRGFPIKKRTDFGVSRPVSFRKTAPRSNSINIINSALPRLLLTTPSSSAKVRAFLVAFTNSAKSGCQTSFLRNSTTALKGFDDVTLNRSVSMFLVAMIFSTVQGVLGCLMQFGDGASFRFPPPLFPRLN